jgi:hypothetical protein
MTGVPGAAVSGTWTYRDRRGRTSTSDQSGVTNSSGTLTLAKTFPRNSTIVSYCVTNVTKTGWTYSPSLITCGYPLTVGVRLERK